MLRRRASGTLALFVPVLLVAGCSDDAAPAGGDPPASPSSCPTGRADDGTITLAIGSQCLRGATLRVLSGGSWKAAGPEDAVDIKETAAAVRLTFSSTRAKVEAFELKLPEVLGSAMLQQGYQSWGFSGVVRIPEEIDVDRTGAPGFWAAREGDPVAESAGVSYGATVIGGGADEYVAIGALSADRATTGIAAGGDGTKAEVTVVYGALREPLPQDDDGKIRSEPIVVLADPEPAAALGKLAAEIAAELPADARPPKRPPGGWFSWNEHFENIDETVILQHVDAMAAKLAPVGMPLLEIDDGWARAWGDWKANERFPGGMEAIASAITAKGLTAGLWMAPFLVNVESEVAQTIDPELLVRDGNGQPLVHTPGGHVRKYYVLDGTNPEAMAIATDAVAAFARAGYRFFKFDFLYAGALAGQRSQPGATGNQALRNGLKLLRAAAGEDAFINACGSPALPVIGIADSLRIGADTVYAGLPPTYFFVAFAARSLAARSWLYPLVWPDADQVLLREPFTDDEARVGAAVAAMAGPAYGLGDDLVRLPQERLEIGLSPDLLDLAGATAPAVALDLFDAPAEAPVGNPVFDAIGSNGETTAPPPSTFSAVGKSGARYELVFSWSRPHQVTIEETK